MPEQPSPSNEKVVDNFLISLKENRETAISNIYGLLEVYQSENIDNIIKQSREMFDKYPGLKEEMEIKLDKLIEDKEDELKTKKGNVDEQQTLINNIYTLNKIRDGYLNLYLDKEPSVVEIHQIGSMSKEDLDKILLGTEMSAKELIVKKIKDLSETFGGKEASLIENELIGILWIYPNLKKTAQNSLGELIIEIQGKIEESKNKAELFNKVEDLVIFLRKISKK